MPSPSVCKKGPRLPPWLPQETRSLEVRGRRQLLPWGQPPGAGACITLQWMGGWRESQAFPVYATNRPPRKGKGLESASLLGGLQ